MTLRTYIIARILLTIPMILILLTMVFLIIRVLPGDPVLLHFQHPTEQQLTEMRHLLGLDKPIWVQYFDYLLGLFRGDLGISMQDRTPVAQQVFSAFPATLELAIFSMIIAVAIGIIFGVQASKAYNKPQDHVIRIFGIVTYALPVFFLGMILQLTLGLGLNWFPVARRFDPLVQIPLGLNVGNFHFSTGLYTIDSLLEGNVYKFVVSLHYLFLPSLTLGLVLAGVFIRLTRSNMLETLRTDFVTAAKARGLSENKVNYSYALRNAFLPVLTMVGLQFAALLGGAILTETTFSWPGLGTYIVKRIFFRDYTAIQGVVIVFGVFVSLVSLAVDLLYAYLDPRIRL